MLNTINLPELWQNTLTWCSGYFWNTEMLYQLILIALSFIVGGSIYRSIRERIRNTIEHRKLPPTSKRIITNLRRLIFPFFTLIILFLSASVLSTTIKDIDTALISTITKVLFAWIIIRLAVQFFDNQAIRNFFSVTIWIIAALSIFGVLGDTMATLDALAFSVGEFRLSALAVIKSILLIFGLLYFATFLSKFAEKKINHTKGLNKSSKVLMAKIVHIVLITVAFLFGVTSAGIDLSVFAVLGGAIGLGIGFGLQKVISNLFSGMLLLTDQSIKPGDVIELENGTFGWVNHMAARYTEIVSRDNKSFLIPNEDFITQRVTNWSHGSKLIRMEVKFGVDYSHNPHKIIAMAEKVALNAHERIRKDPAPVCHFTEFGESSLNFQLRFWITDAEKGVTNMRAAIMLALWDIFQENNIKIPYPRREIYLHQEK